MVMDNFLKQVHEVQQFYNRGQKSWDTFAKASANYISVLFTMQSFPRLPLTMLILASLIDAFVVNIAILGGRYLEHC